MIQKLNKYMHIEIDFRKIYGSDVKMAILHGKPEDYDDWDEVIYTEKIDMSYNHVFSFIKYETDRIKDIGVIIYKENNFTNCPYCKFRFSISDDVSPVLKADVISGITGHKNYEKYRYIYFKERKNNDTKNFYFG